MQFLKKNIYEKHITVFELYFQLEKHDKVMLQSDMRSEEEMEKESRELRKYFNS